MKNFLTLVFGIIIGAAAVYFYCCQQVALEDGFEAPKGIITPAEATALDKAFNTRHQLISDSIVGRPDNRSSWFSLTDMRDYLDFAENQVKDLGYSMNGVRIYLGAYPDTANEVGYTTMFLVPTGHKAKAEGSMNLLNSMTLQGENPDVPGGIGLNRGGEGDPPGANYPQ